MPAMLVRAAFAQPGLDALRSALPGFLTKPAPRWVAPAPMARGPLGLLDARLARDERVRAAIETADGR